MKFSVIFTSCLLLILLLSTSQSSDATSDADVVFQSHFCGQNYPHDRAHHRAYNRARHPRWPTSWCHVYASRLKAPPRPPTDGDEIDPRYGVEKRLVPTGPNPLHN